MSTIFWIAVLTLAAIWAYKNRKTVKGWFKKDATVDKPAAGDSTASTGAPTPTSGATTPPSNAPPGCVTPMQP